MGVTADFARDPSRVRSFQRGEGRRLGHKVCYAQPGNVPALIPGAPAWPGEITGGLNFLSLPEAFYRSFMGIVGA